MTGNSRTPGILCAIVLAATVLAGCSGNKADKDEDGLPDVNERAGWDSVVTVGTHRKSVHFTSDPGESDSDGDGLDDLLEFRLGSDARNKDTDQDGLSDCQESRHRNRAQCEDPGYGGPFDGGFGTEVKVSDSDHGPDRFVNAPGYIVDENDPDSTLQVLLGDGIPDGDEVLGYEVTLVGGQTRRVTTDPLSADSDADGLGDGEERFLFQTDPTVADTDNDQCRDGYDPVPTRDESYRFGLTRFALRRDTGEPGAQLALTITGFGVHRAPANGAIQVPGAAAVNLTAADPPAFDHGACALPEVVPPYDPWLAVSITAVDEGGAGALDIASATASGQPGPTAQIYWNLRTGEYSLQPAPHRDAAKGVIHLVGVDGELWLDPKVA